MLIVSRDEERWRSQEQSTVGRFRACARHVVQHTMRELYVYITVDLL